MEGRAEALEVAEDPLPDHEEDVLADRARPHQEQVAGDRRDSVARFPTLSGRVSLGGGLGQTAGLQTSFRVLGAWLWAWSVTPFYKYSHISG